MNIFDEFRAALFTPSGTASWLALAVAWGVCLAGWLVVAMIPNSYESKARIFVQLDDALAEQVGIPGSDRNKREIERIRQTLTSAVNLEKVVRGTRIGDEVGTRRPSRWKARSWRPAKDIKVVSEQDNLFEITATLGRRQPSDAENAKLAQAIGPEADRHLPRGQPFAGNRGEMSSRR
jgi:uncharacterized protein involved in exopolysaccharide biosynthesis